MIGRALNGKAEPFRKGGGKATNGSAALPGDECWDPVATARGSVFGVTWGKRGQALRPAAEAMVLTSASGSMGLVTCTWKPASSARA
jgi:hypothetical protein